MKWHLVMLTVLFDNSVGSSMPWAWHCRTIGCGAERLIPNANWPNAFDPSIWQPLLCKQLRAPPRDSVLQERQRHLSPLSMSTGWMQLIHQFPNPLSLCEGFCAELLDLFSHGCEPCKHRHFCPSPMMESLGVPHDSFIAHTQQFHVNGTAACSQFYACSTFSLESLAMSLCCVLTHWLKHAKWHICPFNHDENSQQRFCPIDALHLSFEMWSNKG